MDRFESISALIAAADSGSLSAASRKHGTPLATVSRRVAELEAHLGTALVQRSARKLTLTDAGRAYVAACKSIFEQLDEADRVATGEYSAPKGELIVAAPVVFGRLHALPVIVEFMHAYPDVDLRLVLADRVANMLEERIDVALRIGELPDSGLLATRLGQIERVIVASPDYLARHGTPKKPEDLSKHACVTFEGIAAPSSWSFVTAKAKTHVRVHSRLVVNTAEAAIDAALAHVGATRVLSYQVAELEARGELVRLLRAYQSSPLPVHLVYSGQTLLPLKLRAFIDFAVPRLKGRIAELAS